MIENEKQEREEVGKVETESELESEGAADRTGGVATYIKEDWSRGQSSGSVVDYVMSALDYIICGKCKGTYVKGDEHDC